MLFDAIYRSSSLENPAVPITAEAAENDGIFNGDVIVNPRSAMKLAAVYACIYVIDQEIDDIGAGKKFMFCGDFDRFIIRRVRYMILKRLVERYAEFDQTGFLAFHRFDCILEDTSAIKALVGKGSASS